MPRRRARYEQTSWLLVVGLVASPVLHTVIGVAWEELRVKPLPRLTIQPIGEGSGQIVSQPGGIYCGADCVEELERGTQVTLRAIRGDKSTFDGWGAGCKPDPENPLACTLTIEDPSHVVRPVFGKLPEEVEVVFEEIKQRPEQKKEQRMAVALPEPDADFAQLPVPIPDAPPEEPAAPEAPDMPQLAQLQPAAPPQPEQPPPPEPEQPKEEAKEKQQPPPQQMKAVEVPDENEVEDEPDDATYLSDKNRDVTEETRATDTNLEVQRAGETPYSEKSDVQSEEVGAEETEIAQFDEVEETSFDAERVDQTETRGNSDDGAVPKGEAGDDGQEGDGGDGSKSDKPGVLAMRGIDGRGIPGGPVIDRERDDSPSGRAGKRGKKGRRGIKTQLDMDDYRRIVGKKVAETEVELGRKRKSKRLGRWERKQAAVRAALENFIPEVKPGNQTALKTRAHPFALYVNRMHRRIHELWGFGFLEELDKKGATDPMNNWKLQTIVEVAINPDGSIHKTTIVDHSGILMFDVAAIDTLYTGGPYLETPEDIRSADGRVYLHWVFRRDWQQCGTFNVRMYILDQVSEGKIDDGEMVRKMRKTLGKKPPPRGGGQSAGGSADPDAAAASARAMANMPAPDDPRAEHTANLWLTGFAQRDIKKMVRVSDSPFASGDRIVANSLSEIGSVYRTVLAETRGAIRDYKILSPAGYRKIYGNLPPNVDIAAGNLLMAVKAGSERFTLVLKRKANGQYKIVALHR